MKKKILSLLLSLVVLCTLTACSSKQETVKPTVSTDTAKQNIKKQQCRRRKVQWNHLQKCKRYTGRTGSISAEYRKPAAQEGTLVKLNYETWESFSYEQHSQKLNKTAWVYLPCGYDETQNTISFISATAAGAMKKPSSERTDSRQS